MKLAEALAAVDGVPWMTAAQAGEIYDNILDVKPDRIVELGFAYGKSTVVLAAALDELGGGFVDTVDLEVVRTHFSNPGIEELLDRTNLQRYVRVHREEHSYNWWLKKQLEVHAEEFELRPVYDFCYLDGSHNFTIDTCAFTLTDRLLKPGSTILFDDLKYSYGFMSEIQNKSNEPPPLVIDDFDPRCRVGRTHMSVDELQECHIGALYRLVVKTDRNYGDLRETQDGNWGWAIKRPHGHSP